ncbi:MAG: hypothetical protein HYR62_01335 [Actinobacteria bacterium]|nr:hypothetical protein [Actinomycetota bacterium]MBI3688818.1 hypothetical protein [Actinomycetota bacterium]
MPVPPAPKRTVPPYVEDRPSWPPAVQPRRPEPPAALAADDRLPTDDPDDADGVGSAGRGHRSLVLAWTLFSVETAFAAAAGLGLWLGFHALWQFQPYLAVAGSAVVLVGLHTAAGWLRRRQSGAELDMLSSALVVAVGVAITVLPAAFAIRPG